MTYDLYGNWYNKVGHHSALYHAPEETGQDRELNTVNYKYLQTQHYIFEYFHSLKKNISY